MTPIRSIIGSSIRKMFGKVWGALGDYYWNNVVLALRGDKTDDDAWKATTLAMHMNDVDPHWSNTVLAMHMDLLGDTYWSNVVLAMHMDGADNGTTFTDSKGKTVTVYGNTCTKTATKKYGTASGYFDGTGDYLTVPGTDSALAIGTGDFTVEAWVYVIAWSPDGTQTIINIGSYITGFFLRVRETQVDVYLAGGNNYSKFATFNSGQWNHVAVTRSSAVLRVFLNGTQVSTDSAGSTESIPALDFLIGKAQHSASENLNGYIDDLRVTKGVARYTSTFTPPTSEFPEISGGSSYDEKGHTVTFNGNATLSSTQSKFGGYSAYFDGTGDYLSIPSSTDFDFGTGDFTVELWVNPSSITGYKVLVGRQEANVGMALQLYQSDSVIGVTLRAVGGGDLFGIAGGVLSPSVWAQIILCRQGSNIYLLLNGVVVATGVCAFNITPVASRPLTVGVVDDTTLNGYFTGYIDDLRITKGVARYPLPNVTLGDPYFNNVVLSMHMDGIDNGTTFTDVKGKTVTPTSAVTKTATKKYGTASAYISGSGSYLSVATTADFGFGTGAFTVESWVYYSETGFSSRANSLLDFRDVAGNGQFYVSTGGLFSYWNDTTNDACTTVLSVNTWYHLAATYDGTNLRLFVNGTLERTSARSLNFSTTKPLIIGKSWATSTDYWIGYIDDLRITKGVARYTADFIPPQFANYDLQGADVTGTTVFNPPARAFREPNNTSTFYDEKDHLITVTGTPTISATASKFGGKSASFNGTTDYLTIEPHADYGFGTKDFTIECWINTTSSSAALVDLRVTTEMPHVYFAISNGYAAIWNGLALCEGSTLVNTGAWVHLVWVRTRGVLSQYVNGVLDASLPSTESLGTTRPVRIGADCTGAYFYAGYIDDLRITKGFARYIGPFTPPANAFFDPYTKPVLIEDTGKAVTLVGATPQSVTTKYGNGAMYFDGVSDFLTFPASTDYEFGAGDFTVEAWVNLSSLPPSTDTYLCIASADWTSPNIKWFLGIRNLGSGSYSVEGFISTNGTSEIGSRSEWSTASTGVWVHAAMTRSGGIFRAFCNGVLGAISDNSGTAILAGAPVLSVGNSLGSPYTWQLHGYIDDLRITKGVARYVSTFTPPDRAIDTYVKPQYDQYLGNVVLGMHMDGADNGTTFTELTGKTVTVGGNAVTKTASKKFGTASAYFDGTGDYLSVADSVDWAFGSGNFTIECWIKFSVVPSSGQYCSIYSQRTQSGVNDSFTLFYGGTEKWISIYTSDGATWTQTATLSNATPNTGVWQHLAIVRNGASLSLYLDGVVGTSHNIGSTALYDSSAVVMIGATNIMSPTFGFNGYIDDLRITKGVARYTADFIPDQFPFPEKTSDLSQQLGDPYLGNVVLGMHMDGADNGTTFTEVTGKAVTAVGNAVTKTATKKFGTASAYFDGTGDYLSTPITQDFSFGTNPFTVEFWVNIAGDSTLSADTNRPAAIISTQKFGETTFWFIYISGDTTTTGIGVGFYSRLSGVTESVGQSFTLSKNSWCHVAVSSDSTGLYISVNGVVKKSNAITQNIDAGTTATSAYVGMNPEATGYTYPLNGYIDDLRITKGVARYTANFAPPSRFPDILPSDLYDPYYDQVVLSMHMDGADNGTVFTDIKGKVATKSGNVVTKSAIKQLGTASLYSPNATTGDNLTFSGSTDFSTNNRDFTIEFWVYPTEFNGNGGRIIAAGGGVLSFNATNGINWLIQTVGGGVSIQYWDGASVRSPAIIPMTINNWYRVAFVFTAGDLKVFSNGELVSSSDYGLGITSTNPQLAIFKIPGDAAGATQKFGGYIDDLRITKGVARYTANFAPPAKANPDQRSIKYDPYLSNVVLGMHMQDLTDIKGKAVTAYGNAAISTTQSKFGGKSCYFDGTGDYLTLADSADWAFGSGDFTIECWINPSNLTANQDVYAHRDIGDLQNFYFLRVNATTGQLRAFCYVGGSTVTDTLSNSAVSTGVFTHVAVVRSSGTVKIYVNGSNSDTVTTNLTTTYPDIAYPFIIGAGESAGSNSVNGYIDDLRITKGVARYLTNFTVPTVPFLEE